jgi:hypothetical protein
VSAGLRLSGLPHLLKTITVASRHAGHFVVTPEPPARAGRSYRVRPLRASRLLSGYVSTCFDPQALQIRLAPVRGTSVASGTPSAEA